MVHLASFGPMRALGLLLLALLAPTAAACSLAGPVPGPGAFTLVPMEGGLPVVIAVEGRELGAACELSNPHALEGTTFAWRETAWRRSGDTQHEVHLLDLATGEKRIVPYGGQHTDGFWLWNGTLLFVQHDFDGDQLPPETSLVMLDLVTREERVLSFPDRGSLHVSFADGLVSGLQRDAGYEGPVHVWLYDVGAERWLLEDVPMRELIGEEEGWGTVVTREWMTFGTRTDDLLYHIPTGELRRETRDEMSPRGRTWAILDGWAYQSRWNGSGEEVVRYRFPDGEPERVDEPRGLVGIIPGYFVLGDYSAPELHPLGRVRWVEETGILVGAAALGLAGVVAVPTWRRVRARKK